MFKKGQISLFIIVGIVILASIGILVYFMSIGKDVVVLESSVEGAEEIKIIKNSVESCLNDIMDKGIKKYGYSDIEDLELYFDVMVRACFEGVDSESAERIKSEYHENNVVVDEEEGKIHLEVDYSLNNKVEDIVVGLETFEVSYPLYTEYKVPIKDGEVTEDIIISASNNQVKLYISKGTTVINMDNEQVEEISIRIKDPSEYGGVDVGAMGLVYEVNPPYVTFEPPITVEYAYEEKDDLQPEENLRLAYYVSESNEWLMLEDNKVDAEENKVEAKATTSGNISVVNDKPGTGVCGQGQKTTYSVDGWCHMDCTANQPCATGEVNCDCYSSCGPGDSSRCLKQYEDQKNGVTSGGSGGNSPVSGYHHWNPRAWKGKGVAIVLCPGEKASGCTFNGKSMKQHGSLDKGRYVYTIYGHVGTGGTVTCGGKSFSVSGGSSIQYGSC